MERPFRASLSFPHTHRNVQRGDAGGVQAGGGERGKKGSVGEREGTSSAPRAKPSAPARSTPALGAGAGACDGGRVGGGGRVGVGEAVERAPPPSPQRRAFFASSTHPHRPLPSSPVDVLAAPGQVSGQDRRPAGRGGGGGVGGGGGGHTSARAGRAHKGFEKKRGRGGGGAVVGVSVVWLVHGVCVFMGRLQGQGEGGGGVQKRTTTGSDEGGGGGRFFLSHPRRLSSLVSVQPLPAPPPVVPPLAFAPARRTPLRARWPAGGGAWRPRPPCWRRLLPASLFREGGVAPPPPAPPARPPAPSRTRQADAEATWGCRGRRRRARPARFGGGRHLLPHPICADAARRFGGPPRCPRRAGSLGRRPIGACARTERDGWPSEGV